MTREAIWAALSQPAASLVTITIIGGMCAAVLLTTGRTVGAEQDVLRSIDQEGTRSIVVRAQPNSGLQSSVLRGLNNVEGIEWAGGFGEAQDSRNRYLPTGTPVGVREVWSADFTKLGVQTSEVSTASKMTWVSNQAAQTLGLSEAAGGLVSSEGVDYQIAGSITTPDFLQFFEPLALTPQPLESSAPVSVLVVIAERSELVGPVSEAVRSLLAVEDPANVTFSTSEQLAELRGLVENQLGASGRGLILIVFGVAALLISTLLYGLTYMRRKDYGRRRALGASRRLVIGLVLGQTALLAIVGAFLGSCSAVAALAIAGDPVPDAGFITAVGVLAVATSISAGLIPAYLAARRDPIRELRVA